MCKVIHAWVSRLQEGASKEVDQWLLIGWRGVSGDGPRGLYPSLTPF